MKIATNWTSQEQSCSSRVRESSHHNLEERRSRKWEEMS